MASGVAKARAQGDSCPYPCHPADAAHDRTIHINEVVFRRDPASATIETFLDKRSRVLTYSTARTLHAYKHTLSTKPAMIKTTTRGARTAKNPSTSPSIHVNGVESLVSERVVWGSVLPLVNLEGNTYVQAPDPAYSAPSDPVASETEALCPSQQPVLVSVCGPQGLAKGPC